MSDGLLQYIAVQLIRHRCAVKNKENEYNTANYTKNTKKDIIELFNLKKRLQNSKEKLKKIIIKYETELKEAKSEYDRCYHYDIDTIDVDNYVLKLKKNIEIAKELAKKFDIEIIENKIEESIEMKNEIENDEKIIYI